MKRTYPDGVPCWVDTAQPDVELALRFYGGLFGWTFEDRLPGDSPGRYVIARLDGEDVGGISGSEAATAAWNTYVAAADVEETATRLQSLGARVLSAPETSG